ncbi:tyrosine-type recombinase/integrase [Serratia fonticola]|uniref:tyrosine-type recombinase/integrase n=1 Tax=Serratia fonticola TaxID=47917 RepID=UPI00358DB28E
MSDHLARIRQNRRRKTLIADNEKMRPTPLQNSQILRSAIGGDLLATDDRYVRALTLRNRAAVHGDLPYYLLPPEIAVLLTCCHDLEKRTLFEFLWNTGARINEALAVRPADVEFDASPAFVTLRTLKQRLHPKVGRPAAVKLKTPGQADKKTARATSPVKRTVALDDVPFAARLHDHIHTFTEHKTKPIWPVTDDTARNWLKKVLLEADRQGMRFSLERVTPHTFRHSFAMHLLFHGVAPQTLQAVLGHKDFKSTQVYLKVFSLDYAASRGSVPFSMDAGVAAEMLQLAGNGVKKVP